MFLVVGAFSLHCIMSQVEEDQKTIQVIPIVADGGVTKKTRKIAHRSDTTPLDFSKSSAKCQKYLKSRAASCKLSIRPHKTVLASISRALVLAAKETFKSWAEGQSEAEAVPMILGDYDVHCKKFVVLHHRATGKETLVEPDVLLEGSSIVQQSL